MFRTIHLVLITLLFSLSGNHAHAQQAYPKVTGYFSITHPVATLDKDGFTTGFSEGYSVSFPVGINLMKSERFGFSFELSPTIKADKDGAKVSSVLFHPGAAFRFDRGFGINARLAFDTSGRFGVTPVLTQVVSRRETHNYSVSIPFPVRFGNDHPASVGVGLQFGIGF